MRWILAIGIAAFIAGCDQKPEHYYVLCEGKDPIGWNLIGTGTDKSGDYIMACTYQSPDKQESYTVRCTDEGCQ